MSCPDTGRYVGGAVDCKIGFIVVYIAFSPVDRVCNKATLTAELVMNGVVSAVTVG